MKEEIMRKLYMMIAAFVLASMAVIFAACDNGEPTEYSVTLTPATCSMEVGESTTLTCTVTGATETAAFTSSDTAVVTVTDTGTVTAVAVGSATVTAAVGDKSAACQITVTEAVTLPEIAADDMLEFTLNESMTPEISVTYKNTAVDAQLQFTSGNTEIVTVNEAGQFTAVGYGRTNVTVTATYLGRTAQKQIVVVVQENAALTFAESEMTLTVGDTETVEYTLQINGTPVTDRTLAWTSSAPDVVSVTNGELTAHKGGTATVTASYTAADGITTSEELAVTVALLQDSSYADESLGTYDLSLSEIEIVFPENQTVTNVMLQDGVIVPFEQTPGEDSVTLKLDTENLQQQYGERILVIETETTAYQVKTTLASMIVSDTGEWAQMFTLAASLGGENEWRGYFTLDQDIDFAEAAVSGVTGEKTASQGWLATFDGCGHTVSNFSLAPGYRNGLFGSIGTGGAVRNLAVVDFAVNCPASGAIASDLYGTVENVYLQGEIHHTGNNDGHGGIAYRINPGATLRNVVAEVEIGFTDRGETAIAALGFVYEYVLEGGVPSSVLADNSGIENCYVISTTITAALRKATGTYSQTTLENYPADTVKLYDSYAAMKAADNDYASFSGSCWKAMSAGDIPVWHDYAIAVSGAETVIAGNTAQFTASEGTATFTLRTPVDGVSITPEGLLTVGGSVADGTQIFVVATSALNASVTAEKTVAVTARPVVETPVDLGKWVVSDIPEGGMQITSSDIQGTISSVSIGGSTISQSANITADAVKQYYGPQTLTVITNSGVYTNVSVLVVTDVITTITEWDNMFTLAKELGGDNEWKGYFELGANLDFDTVETEKGGVPGLLTEQQGWLGTLDGCGYAVRNYFLNKALCGDTGIIGSIGSTGVVKNLAVVGVTVNSVRTGAIASRVYGTIENVYVQGNINHSGNADGHGGIAYRLMSGAEVQNCIVDIYSAWAGGQNNAGIGYAYAGSDNSGIANCYVIDRKTGNDPLPGAVLIATDDYTTTTEVCGGLVNVAMYDGEASFAEAENDLSSFSSDVWTVDGYNVPVFNFTDGSFLEG